MLKTIRKRLILVSKALAVGGKAAGRVLSSQRQIASGGPYFEPLTPVVVTNGRSARYERELLHALENPDVLNIALTGSYGAGKSSVLKTFFSNNPQFSHTYVSLATFTKPTTGLTPQPSGQPIDSDSPIASVTSDIEPGDLDLVNRIEETIVQQLLYAVPAAKLPKTRLKRIAQASNLRIYLRTLGFALLTICALRLYLPKLASIKTLSLDWLLAGLMILPESAALAGVVVGGVCLLYAGLKFMSLFTIDGLTLKGGKLEATHHSSVLHKNVDEIIYCFERSDINVVVIEDLDRFDIQDIFFRLREINFIIQRSPQVKRPVHFIYAIRDELFTVTDKTKFFDLIIPVIPVINSENSKEKLVELMKARHFDGKPLDDGLNLNLIETVCYYIDEMRLIKNIVNEYDIYLNVLAKDGLKLDLNKLFAMVAIRNLHPNAYADLVKRRGAIYGVIEGYLAWRNAEAEVLEARIQELKDKRVAREGEVADSLQHLRMAVWFEVLKLGSKPNANHVRLESGNVFTLIDFVTDAAFAQVVENQQVIPMVASPWHDTGQSVPVKKVLREVKYEERLARFQVSLDQLDQQLEESRHKLLRLKTAGFRQIVSMGYAVEVARRLKGLELITFLIHRCFFDTDYVDYLGYFYEGSLTQSDKNLIMGLVRGEEYDVATAIHNPELVASKLDLDSVDNGRGIMVELICELLQVRKDEVTARKNKLGLIIKSGTEYPERFAEAVASIIPGCHSSVLLKALYATDRNLIPQLLKHDRFIAPILRQQFLVALLDSLIPEELQALDDQRGFLRKAINEIREGSALTAKLATNQAGWQWLRTLPAQFSHLDPSVSGADLRLLVEWGCLALNLDMLRLLCQVLNPKDPSDRVTYHRLSQMELKGLNRLIEEDPDRFVTELTRQEGSLEETPESIIALFNLCGDDATTLQKLFDQTTCAITSLDLIPNSLWLHAMESGRVCPVGAAAWTFFNRTLVVDKESSEFVDLGDSAPDTFAQFLKENAEELSGELWHEPTCNPHLQTYLIRSPQIENSTLRTLFSNVVLSPEIAMDTAMPQTRWALFAYNDMVGYSEEIRAFIAEHAPQFLGPYLIRRWDFARHQLDLSSLPVSVACELSRAAVCSTAEVISIWSGIPFDAYEACNGAVESLAKTCKQASLEGFRFPIVYLSTLLKLIHDGALTKLDRVNILIHVLSMGCSWSETAELLPLAGKEYPMLLTKRRVTFPPHDLDRRLIEALAARGFVGKVKPDAKCITVWSKRN